MIRTATDRLIATPPERVWDVLADFSAYPEWNPLVLAVEGRPGPNAEIFITIDRPDKPGTAGRMKVRIEEWEPAKALSWSGGPWPILRGLHWFRLAPERGGTRFRHGEDSRGLYPLLFGRRFAGYARIYEAFNEALARRAEHGFRKIS